MSMCSYQGVSWRSRSLEFINSIFKQGPAYKKEGPDPNKGSNQQ